ncbi:glycoside hydrolase family 99-like domain-containing protein [Paucibacter sp. B2R-40]|uniref:glycosyltransferase WbsX family protein n=1 Tax=Paucibacter sp. B2R-40 TaxID=2893554 RepID=UPI0021E51063|nr:glycoside hydrolase family 99-like domain-containing protein [Paucibacter sp. B2R-40]MCV2355499.1 glycoside hydrolase family 99-like domain-containing protein [Paucibacter sp. B2R-40]
MTNKTRVIAMYLPQYHPIPENDGMWGKGFTEWNNVVKAKPLFPGHYQPKLPADLGYYDLRLPETREAQAELAREFGIEGFCYYHYWFAGSRLLERPFTEVLATGKPDFPFCLCWANESWSGVWVGRPDQIIMEQTYPGPEEHANHFRALLPAFQDKRYIRIDGKPVFLVYRPMKIPELSAFVLQWQTLAKEAGLPGIYFIGVNHRNILWEPIQHGFDASVAHRLPDTRPWVSLREPMRWMRHKMQKLLGRPTIYPYAEVLSKPVFDEPKAGQSYPTVYPNWDTSARHGSKGLVMHNASPEVFGKQLRAAQAMVAERSADHRLIFLKSWNEWAEGNYVEPDKITGTQFLEEIRKAVK